MTCFWGLFLQSLNLFYLLQSLEIKQGLGSVISTFEVVTSRLFSNPLLQANFITMKSSTAWVSQAVQQQLPVREGLSPFQLYYHCLWLLLLFCKLQKEDPLSLSSDGRQMTEHCYSQKPITLSIHSD